MELKEQAGAAMGKCQPCRGNRQKGRGGRVQGNCRREG